MEFCQDLHTDPHFMSYASLIAQLPTFHTISIRMRSATIAVGIKYDRVSSIGFLQNAQGQPPSGARLAGPICSDFSVLIRSLNQTLIID